MKKVRSADVENIANRPSVVARNLSASLETTDVGIRYYELDPGELVGRTYHKHEDQEEIFHVTEGTITFEVGDRYGPTDEIDLDEGEWIRFAPGDWQRGRNKSNNTAAVIGVGAPKGMSLDQATRLRECSECDAWTRQNIETLDGEGVSLCAECGTESGRWG